MKKRKRGTAEFATDKVNKIVVCRWMDNSVILVASTIYTNDALCKVRPYSQSEKKNVEVDCPKMIQEYNKHMGGTDRQDQNINKYRIAFRGKKVVLVYIYLVD